ncbi:hypothetical protein QBC37DRAFT_374789 [Rhypophila decipiens]|uniref:F-box domain-containing protein n=1 Tax=Rhypophila decipiens TaxID=261697 RepID=A0AAN6Y5U0_9PEZI|nr:hypothetical protein QBC37DRAFT_374789 [Rhypophila decipiens]
MAETPAFSIEDYAAEWGFVLDGPPKPNVGTSLFPHPEPLGRDIEPEADDHQTSGHRHPGNNMKRITEDETWDHDSLEGNFLYDPELDHNKTGRPTEARYVTSIASLISTYRKMEAEGVGHTLWPMTDADRMQPDRTWRLLRRNHANEFDSWEQNHIERVPEFERLPSQSKGPTTYDLGALSGVPVEVLERILDNCTIQSLLQLRRVNRMAEVTVHSLPVWKTLSFRLPHLLKTLLSPTIPVAQYITAGQLLRKLVQIPCDQCGLPGDRMNLLSLERFCRFCEGDHRFQIFRASNAMRAWGLPVSEQMAVAELPYVENEILKHDDNLQSQMALILGLPDPDPRWKQIQEWGFRRVVAGSQVHDVALRYYGKDAIGKIKAIWREESGGDGPGQSWADHSWASYRLRQSLLPPIWMTRWPHDIQREVINKLRPRVPWLVGNIRTVIPGVPRLDWGFRCFACENLIREFLDIRTRQSNKLDESLLADPYFAPLRATDPWHFRLYTDETFEAHVKSMGGHNAINTAGFHKCHKFFVEEDEEGRGDWVQRLTPDHAEDPDLVKKKREILSAKFFDPHTWHLDNSTWKRFRPAIRSARTR